MTTEYTGWRRDKEGLGLWEGQGKVAIVGWGQSPVDRRWDGVSMDKTYGAYGMMAIQQALDDAEQNESRPQPVGTVAEMEGQ